jgi:hypothetical protein
MSTDFELTSDQALKLAAYFKNTNLEKSKKKYMFNLQFQGPGDTR